MDNPARSNDTFESSLLARLDSQDVEVSKALREYLTSQGCAVVENERSSISAHYHIIFGDSDFVKRILENFGKLSSRVLVISWDESTKLDPKVGVPHVKLVLVDFQPFDEENISQLFQFFFTGSSSFLDLRKRYGRGGKRPAGADKERIDTLIEDIFEKKNTNPRPKADRRMRWGIVLVFFLIIPLLGYASTITASLLSYAVSSRFLRAGDSAASQKAAGLGVAFSRAGKILVSAGFLPGQERLFSLLTDSGLVLLRLANTVSRAQSLGSVLLSNDQGVSDVHPAVILDRLRTDVASLMVDVGLLQAELTRLSRDGIFPLPLARVLGMEGRLNQRLQQSRELISDFDAVLLLYKEAGGFRRAQSYLVLLQNSMELRPTGGFIGSVGKLTMLDGKINEFTIWDVYELDGQLRGHVDPPEPIRTILGEEHWYLRDSNWDPDFAVSAERAAWFYEKEMASDVDGVIGLTSVFLPKLLASTGPIDLSDYNDRVTEENFYGKALFYTKENFFPGSTQKKDFLGSLTRAIFTRMENGSGVNTSALLGGLVTGLGNRDIQLFFFDEDSERLAQAFGWAGHMSEVAANELPIAVIDSNLGVNKANFFLESEIDRDIDLDGQGNLTETLTFSQTNKGDDSVYKSYTRFYLPPEAQVGEVTVGATLVPKDNDSAVGGKLPFWQELKEHKRVVVGVAATLSPRENRQIRISYKAADSYSTHSPLQITTRAQAGQSQMPLSITIRAPTDQVMTLIDESGSQVASAGQVGYNTTLSVDQRATISFSP